MVKFKHELAIVGYIIPNSILVRIALKSFTKKWEVFVKCIEGRENIIDWSKMWDDFYHEDIREGSPDSQFNEEVENNLALETKFNKNNKDISQVRCY